MDCDNPQHIRSAPELATQDRLATKHFFEDRCEASRWATERLRSGHGSTRRLQKQRHPAPPDGSCTVQVAGAAGGSLPNARPAHPRVIHQNHKRLQKRWRWQGIEAVSQIRPRGSAPAQHCAGTFSDYFEHLLGYEVERAAMYDVSHHCTLSMNPREADDLALANSARAPTGVPDPAALHRHRGDRFRSADRSGRGDLPPAGASRSGPRPAAAGPRPAPVQAARGGADAQDPRGGRSRATTRC